MSIDKQITILEQQKTRLEDYKKTLSTKIFTQSKRFKGFTKEWQTVKLGDIGKTYTGLTGKTKKDFGKGNPFITYMNIYKNYVIDKNNLDYVNLDVGEKQNSVKYGDIFFTTSSETIKEVAMSSVLLETMENTFLNSFCFGYRLDNFNSLLPLFATYYLRSYAVRRKIIINGQGAIRFNISKTAILNLTLKLPTIQEQEKIAHILSNIDHLITQKQTHLTQTLKYKTYLLQNMFI